MNQTKKPVEPMSIEDALKIAKYVGTFTFPVDEPCIVHLSIDLSECFNTSALEAITTAVQSINPLAIVLVIDRRFNLDMFDKKGFMSILGKVIQTMSADEMRELGIQRIPTLVN